MYPDALASPQSAARAGNELPFVAERLLCAAALVLLAPVWVTAAAVIAVLSRESPFVAVLRAGRFGRPLWLLKIRTMWPRDRVGARSFHLVERVVDEDGPNRKGRTDTRITSKFARFCRKFSIDEIPQLFHVIAGEMSLVAPRPLTSSELREHYGDAAAEVLSVRPGITGLWQVSGRNSLSYAERRTLDVLLVRTLNARLYLRILLRTVPVVLRGTNSC
ncbi:MAG TPA: sugar transferase [Bryobacteraceae bacterium]